MSLSQHDTVAALPHNQAMTLREGVIFFNLLNSYVVDINQVVES